MKYAIGLLFLAPFLACAQQQWEAGANVGYGWYRDGTIFSSGETAQAGVRNRFTAGIDLTDQFSDYLAYQFS
ncbi:MAG TPA: hypothetical protein VKS01_03700, partial [Bryobacteraceae bacterium]|nr:hypothetical protein [Bryobacteraceae bacterium]